MGLHDYLRVIRERWLVMLVLTTLGTGLAAGWTFSQTPEYQSTAEIFVSTQESSSGEAYQGGLFSQQRVKSYAKLMRGEELSQKVVEALHLSESARDLSKRITTSVEQDTVVLSVSVTDESPAQAQRITQTIAEIFVDYVVELETPTGKPSAPVKATLVDRADHPEEPIKPVRLRDLSLGLLIGFLAGLGLATLRDSTDTRIKKREDLVAAVGDTPDLGTIPTAKSLAKGRLTNHLSPHDPTVEAFRVLAANLQFLSVDSKQRVFVVTSATPGEGKSTTASNLSLALASGANSVLLIDADLRRPTAAESMGATGSVGITTLLIGRITLEEAIQQIGGVDVLASGKQPPNPTALLQSDAMTQLLDKVRGEYDFIIIDAPPLLPVADAALLAQRADGAILVIHHGATRIDEVRNASQRLDAVGATLLGTITNMAPKSRSGGYGYGYGYAPQPQAGRRTKSRGARVLGRSIYVGQWPPTTGQAPAIVPAGTSRPIQRPTADGD